MMELDDLTQRGTFASDATASPLTQASLVARYWCWFCIKSKVQFTYGKIKFDFDKVKSFDMIVDG